MKITEHEASRLARTLLTGRNAPENHAVLQAQVLIDAELKGHPSHGLQRLPRLLKRMERGLLNPDTEGIGHWRCEAVLDVDGEQGFGPVVTVAAVRRLVERVKTTGIAIAAVRNSNHLGMLAWYVERVAAEGRIGIAMSSSEALVHPHGGTRAMLGTNPLAIAVPTAGRPLVLDLATSTVSMGKIHHHAATGQRIPEGWARDVDGSATTDPERAKLGAIAPFGGAKGYGIGLAIELLVASIAGSALAPRIHGTLDAEALCNKGDVLIVIEPSLERALGERLAAYLDAVRDSPPADPAATVRVPGDGAARRRDASRSDGFEIAPRLWDELNALALSSAPLYSPEEKIE